MGFINPAPNHHLLARSRQTPARNASTHVLRVQGHGAVAVRVLHQQYHTTTGRRGYAPSTPAGRTPGARSARRAARSRSSHAARRCCGTRARTRSRPLAATVRPVALDSQPIDVPRGRIVPLLLLARPVRNARRRGEAAARLDRSRPGGSCPGTSRPP